MLERQGDAIRFHPTLLELAAHYRYAPKPCAPGRGNEKGRVERAIRYIRESFFAAREFGTLDELNAHARAWCEGLAADRRWPEDHKRRVRDVFAEERARLLELPEVPFPAEEIVPVSVGKTPYARFDLNDYSVPHTYARRDLTCVASIERVRLCDGATVVADHERCYSRGERLEDPAHIEALASVEQGLQAGGSCDAPVAPGTTNPLIDTSIPAVTKAQIDLAVTGLACGLTNVATIQLSHTVSPSVFSWVDGVAEGHHALSHIDDSNAAGVAQFAACERWSAEQFAYLIEQLKALPEPDGEGTMLDNSVVLWAKEMGDSRAHVCTDVPFVLAGSACGYFKTGQYLSFAGEPHNKLMVSICNALGLTNETFGEASFGAGPLAGLAS